MRGSLFENYVIAEYLKMGRHQGKIPKIYFWRDNTGNEIDMLIDQGDALHAVEIKSGTTIQQRDFFTACGNLKNIPASAQKTVTWYMAEIKPSSAKTGRYLTGAAFICCRDYEPVALFESVRAKKIMMSSSPFT
jgi:Holliday junction resolvase-like predicted endonuclease